MTFSHFLPLCHAFFSVVQLLLDSLKQNGRGLELQAQSRCVKSGALRMPPFIGSAIVREIERLDNSPNLVKRVGEFARSPSPIHDQATAS